jgi:hypothetical protein
MILLYCWVANRFNPYRSVFAHRNRRILALYIC